MPSLESDPSEACFAPNTIGAMIRQLRIYEIFEETKAAFHERFRDHAARIMAKYDFRFVAAWESTTEGRVEFVYVLEWPDEATMVDRWAAFRADEEWAAVKQETNARHGALVGEIQDRVLEPVPYLADLLPHG
jgi:NIPSNAP